MRPDPGRDLQESVIAKMTPMARTRQVVGLRARGRLMVWQQLDDAGLVDPIAQAGFVLRRLYPEMSESWFVDVLGKLQQRRTSRGWAGFERPAATRD